MSHQEIDRLSVIQVNVAEDQAKHGVQATDVFLPVERLVQRVYASVQLRGLMIIGRFGAGETGTCRTFADRRSLLEQCRTRFGEQLDELSMGMSREYELAIPEGATKVRVGMALFRARGAG